MLPTTTASIYYGPGPCQMLHLHFHADTQLREISLPSFSPLYRWGTETGRVTSQVLHGKAAEQVCLPSRPTKALPRLSEEGDPLVTSCLTLQPPEGLRQSVAWATAPHQGP